MIDCNVSAIIFHCADSASFAFTIGEQLAGCRRNVEFFVFYKSGYFKSTHN